jgi:hypothetical protein
MTYEEMMNNATPTDTDTKTKPGRKPGAPAAPVVVDVNAVAIAQATEATNALGELAAGYGQGRDLVNQLLGQAQAFQAAGNLLQTFGVSKLALVKENKLYQQLSGMRTPNGLELKGTWVEFCELLGISDEKANQDIANLKAFGEEALEQMQRIGIGYRELRQYRKLPADQKQALIEVAKAGDKEGFVELAEEIIAKHAKEKATLTAQVEEAAADLEAKNRVLADLSSEVTDLKEQTARKFKPRAGSEAQTQEEQAVLDELDAASLHAVTTLRKLFLAADVAMQDAQRESIQTRARQAVEFVAQQLAEISTEFGIAVNFEEMVRPAWLDEGTLDAMEAVQRGQKLG